MSNTRARTGDGPAERRVALITGGTRGIGLGVAEALAREGWTLALCGVRPREAVLELLQRFDVDVDYWQVDLASREDRSRLAAGMAERYGCINALVNNAGRAPRTRADLLDATEESFEELMRVNLQGPYFLTQAIATQMIAQRESESGFAAAIVFITSVSAELASIHRGEYCVSKAGLSMAARLFALRLAASAIPVFEVRPGVIATDMTAPVRDAYDQRIANGLIPEGRWGQPEDVGRTVAALLRGDVAYATGTVIHVDGGLSLPRL